MATAKRARVRGNQSIAIAPAANPTTCTVTVNIFDGTRQLIKQGTQILMTITDGAQNQLYRDYVSGPTVSFQLPIHNNFADNYAVVAWATDYEQAGYRPVTVGPQRTQSLDLMLLPKNGGFHFAHAKWADLQQERPKIAQIFEASASNSATAYSNLMESHPDQLACLLNLTTAMQQIALPTGSPIDYFKTFDLAALKPDRIFGYADAALISQVKAAAQQGEFATEPAIDVGLHGDATSSYKQIQFGEANVQLTFHEKNTKTINGVSCVYVEPDIDYYKDTGAHLLLEVIPNGLTGALSNPRVVYVLRWIAGQHAGVPNFDPLYTIE